MSSSEAHAKSEALTKTSPEGYTYNVAKSGLISSNTLLETIWSLELQCVFYYGSSEVSKPFFALKRRNAMTMTHFLVEINNLYF